MADGRSAPVRKNDRGVTGRGGVAIAASMLVATVLGSAQVGAVDEGSQQPQRQAAAATSGWLRDVESYAREFDVSFDEASRRAALLQDLDRLIAAAREASSIRWAGGWVQHEPTFGLVLRFTGQDSGLDEVHELIRQAPVPVSFETGATHSMADLEAAHDRLRVILGERWPRVGSGIDVSAGRLLITSPTPISQADIANLAGVAGVPVSVMVGGATQQLHTYGGKRLTNTGSGTDACTAGFTVRNLTTGVEGLTTAGHCPNPLTYWQDGSTSYPLTYMGVRWDADQDVQWHKEDVHVVYPKFWDGSALRSQHALVARLDMPNDFVCHYGISSGFSCGTVITIHFDPGDYCGPEKNDPCDATWVLVDGTQIDCDFGDSGGPVFFGTNLYGTLIFGSINLYTEECYWLAFMSIGFVTSGGMNLEVLLE